MKAILEFDLDNPDDLMNYKRCVNVTEMACFIWELKHNFWRKWKHDDSDFNLETFIKSLDELMDAYDVNVEELIT